MNRSIMCYYINHDYKKKHFHWKYVRHIATNMKKDTVYLKKIPLHERFFPLISKFKYQFIQRSTKLYDFLISSIKKWELVG